MTKTTVIVDSIACLPREMAAQLGIRIMPARIFFNGQLYRDMIDLSSAQAYAFLDKAPQYWESSAASPEDYAQAYRELAKDGQNVLVITISAKLSMFYNSATAAKEMVQKEAPASIIEIINSETAAAAEGLIALAAARATSAGKPFAEVTAIAQKVKERVKFLGLLETIRYVYRTGRIPRLASQIGTMLALKPILTDGDGTIHFAGLVRSKRLGIEKMIRMMREQAGPADPIHVAVMHADAREAAETLKARIAAEFDCSELFVADFSPVMAYATGRGTLALAFYRAW